MVLFLNKIVVVAVIVTMNMINCMIMIRMLRTTMTIFVIML